MKKPTLIIGKKQVILSCLTLMLAVAVYVNYSMSKQDGNLVDTADLTSTHTYGETEFVNAEAAETVEETEAAEQTEETDEAAQETPEAASFQADDYFAQARLERTSSRDEAVATLQSIIGGGDRTEDELVTDAIAAVETSKLIESESNIESLIKSQGYADCIVYLDGESAKVVVKTDGLDAAQAAAIKDVILGEVTLPAENIRIFEVNS
jgi:stage III sporulation protein AH